MDSWQKFLLWAFLIAVVVGILYHHYPVWACGEMDTYSQGIIVTDSLEEMAKRLGK